MLDYIGFAGDHCADPTFHVNVFDAISRAQRDIRTVGFFVDKLYYDGEEM